jgi:hypothetical protein
LDALVPIFQRALHLGCVQRALSKRLLDAFAGNHPADKQVFEKPSPWCTPVVQDALGCRHNDPHLLGMCLSITGPLFETFFFQKKSFLNTTQTEGLYKKF